jgi:hypothetical protein
MGVLHITSADSQPVRLPRTMDRIFAVRLRILRLQRQCFHCRLNLSDKSSPCCGDHAKSGPQQHHGSASIGDRVIIASRRKTADRCTTDARDVECTSESPQVPRLPPTTGRAARLSVSEMEDNKTVASRALYDDVSPIPSTLSAAVLFAAGESGLYAPFQKPISLFRNAKLLVGLLFCWPYCALLATPLPLSRAPVLLTVMLIGIALAVIADNAKTNG